MNKFVKIPSNETGVFDKDHNIITFTIEGGDQYNLSNSYLELTAKITQETNNSDVTGAVYNYAWRWKDLSGVPFPNAALVKHCRLVSSQKGSLEDRRNNHILVTQLKQYGMSMEDREGQGYQLMCQPVSQNNVQTSLGLELVKEGTLKSRVVDAQIRIPLSDLFELGKTKVFPADKLGRCLIRGEFNFDKIEIVQLQGTNAEDYEFGCAEYKKFQNETSNISVTKLKTNSPFFDVRSSPYFTNQHLLLTFDISGGGSDISKNVLVTEITKESDDTLTLTFNPSVYDASGTETLKNISASGVNASNLEYSFTNAEITLERLGKKTAMNELVYMSYTEEQDSGNSLRAFSRQYHLEPECFNVLVAVPDNTSKLICRNDSNKYESYRFRVNDKDLTNRDVKVGKPLYYDGISRWHVNQSRKLKDINEVHRSVTSSHEDRSKDFNNVFIGSNVPLTETQKLLQLDINTSTDSNGLQDIHLYKSVAKSLKL